MKRIRDWHDAVITWFCNLPIVRSLVLEHIICNKLRDMEKQGLVRLVKDEDNLIIGIVPSDKLKASPDYLEDGWMPLH